jgi:hypothetical protein
MSGHRADMVNGNCEACHSGSNRFPVLTGFSDDLEYKSCAGCHGRQEDGEDPTDPNCTPTDPGCNTKGWAAGLRQHHWAAGVTICGDCHDQRTDLGIGVTDADPANFTTVGEHVLPWNYKSPAGDNSDVPDDPCDSGTSFEDKLGAARGLDNDGEGFYDGNDPDCGAVATTPGETTNLLVTVHNPATQVLSLTYSSACNTTDNRIVYGPLDELANYGYTGEECGIGNGGSFNWSYQVQQCAILGTTCSTNADCMLGSFDGGPCLSTPDSFFFLVVGEDAAVTEAEGSYGTDSTPAERPRKLGGTCWLPQDLARSCD